MFFFAWQPFEPTLKRILSPVRGTLVSVNALLAPRGGAPAIWLARQLSRQLWKTGLVSLEGQFHGPPVGRIRSSFCGPTAAGDSSKGDDVVPRERFSARLGRLWRRRRRPSPAIETFPESSESLLYENVHFLLSEPFQWPAGELERGTVDTHWLPLARQAGSHLPRSWGYRLRPHRGH